MKKLFINSIFCLLLATNLNTTFAETDEGWYVAPTIAALTTDSNRPNQDDTGTKFGIALGKEISNNINLEFGFANTKLDMLSGNDLSEKNYELDGLYFFNRESSFAPYLVGGLGMVKKSKAINGTQTNPTWGGGIGAFTDLGDFLGGSSLRTEVRFQQQIDSSNREYDDVIYRVGLNIPLGTKAVAVAAAPVVVAMTPKDSDNDGVNDDDDKCPSTPAGTVVNSFGCKVDGDSDNDGVKDSMDQCPNTTAGTVVDSRGCPVDPDSDNDGVPNSKDQCPNTAQGVRVDFKGCEIRDVITLPGINFELNSAQLTSSSAATLDGAAETLNKYTDISAEVAGHTDSTGAASYNLSLSDRRAQSVKDYLINRGVAASRLSSKGYGETQPIADNSSKDGRAMNRRVELNVVK